jgi:hypothetical protein
VLSDSHRWPIGIYRSAFPEVGRAVEDSDCPQRPIVASLLLDFFKSELRPLIHSTAPEEVRARHLKSWFHWSITAGSLHLLCGRIALAVVSRMLAWENPCDGFAKNLL